MGGVGENCQARKASDPSGKLVTGQWEGKTRSKVKFTVYEWDSTFTQQIIIQTCIHYKADI